MAAITRRFTIHGTQEAIFKAVSTAEGLRGWWTRACEPSANADEIDLRFRRGEVVFRMKTTQYEFPRLVEWTNLSTEPATELNGTRLVFELFETKDGVTPVRLCHDGWADESDWFEHFSDGWDYFAKSLQDYVERGEGTPDDGIVRDEDLAA